MLDEALLVLNEHGTSEMKEAVVGSIHCESESSADSEASWVWE